MKKRMLSKCFKKAVLLSILLSFALPAAVWADAKWPRPSIVAVPDTAANASQQIVSLNGTWKFNLAPPDAFWENDVDTSHWNDISVPGEAFMQGFAIQQDVEYPYRTIIPIPETFGDKNLILRFDGVYSSARVWVNGVLLKQHEGGFTTWDVDITEHVAAGETAFVTVGVTDRSDDIARGSFYAKHNIGGILRDVTLLVLPKDHLARLHVETSLDKAYTDATLTVSAAMNFDQLPEASLHLSLLDPFDAPVLLWPNKISLSRNDPATEIVIPIKAVTLWDAEHPNLYTLEARLEEGGVLLQTFTKKIGFREIEVVKQQLLVNGRPVKLRGVNRHSIDPLKGRTETEADVLADVLLFQDANINFVRTSHYPPTHTFLEYADQYGLYVEVEAPVTWWNAMPDSSGFTARFMGQFTEMIERDRSHASVIIWSLGNESFWDPNFMLEYEYAKQEDPSRPLMWSYAPPAGPEGGRYDIHSEHYPQWDAELEQRQMPILLDEYAHVTSYEFPVLQRDPNIRNFWGVSLKKFWENIVSTKNILGGAIWGGIDEVFFAPGQPYGYGQWGIVDGWRRLKPEFWLTKKAYSPIRIVDAPLSKPGAGEPLALEIRNWFDHTNLNEITIVWSVGGDSGVVNDLDIAPHSVGNLILPGRKWREGDRLSLRFYRNDTLLVDEYSLAIGRLDRNFPPVVGPAPDISESDSAFNIKGKDFSLQFNKTTGHISAGNYKGHLLVTGGPRLNLTPVLLKPWTLADIDTAIVDHEAIITISGSYGEIKASFTIHVDGSGLITTHYRIENLPDNLQELGVSYSLVDQIDRLSWDRQALWSVYPEDHIGRPSGTAQRRRAGGNENYRQKPDWPWSMDMKDFFLFGPDDPGRSTNDFRSTKENIYYAFAGLAGNSIGVRVESNGSEAVRMGNPLIDCMVDDKDPALVYRGKWEAYDDTNCRGTEEFSNEKGASVEFRFYGDQIKWIGPTHHNLGKASVFIDGEQVGTDIDLYSQSKIYQRILFSKFDIPIGWHTIKIVVTGSKNPAATDTYVVIDGFHYSDSREIYSDSEMNILNEWGYDLKWGNYKKHVDVPGAYSNTVRMRLMDMGAL